MDENLHSPQRRLIELRMEHADLDELIDRNALDPIPYFLDQIPVNQIDILARRVISE